MRYIGIRANVQDVYYSILEKIDEKYNIISISNIKVPKALDVPKQLSYIRNTLITIIEQYNIKYASIREIEGFAMSRINKSSLFRINLEGVIQEVFASSPIIEYDLACNSSVKSILNSNSNSILEIADELKLCEKYNTDDLKKLKDENKESVVVAISILKKKGEY
jgi:Holliday junction resolvasome RuvABC endonuclease subunit